MSKRPSTKEELTQKETNPSSLDKNSAQEKEKENRKFIILRSLGQGSFGKVKEALHVLTQEKLAIKILEKDRVRKAEDLVRINREMLILTKVHHPNIIQLYEIIETRRYYFFVMEYAKKGELSRYIKKMVRLSEPEACSFFIQIITGIEYLNSLGYAHRDIKPNNLLLDEDLRIKIIDFGLGNIYDQSQLLKTPCGSPCYAAPEVIAGEPYEPLKVDIWSAGITLFAMVCGYLPFDEENKATLYQKI
jgi:5'-AMP-activated protein kinase catalytic alpha subunit